MYQQILIFYSWYYSPIISHGSQQNTQDISLLNVLLKTMMQICTIIFASFEKCCCHHRMTSSWQDIDCMYTQCMIDTNLKQLKVKDFHQCEDLLSNTFHCLPSQLDFEFLSGAPNQLYCLRSRYTVNTINSYHLITNSNRLRNICFSAWSNLKQQNTVTYAVDMEHIIGHL